MLDETISVCESVIGEEREPVSTTFTTSLYENGALESVNSRVEQGNFALPHDSVESSVGFLIEDV